MTQYDIAKKYLQNLMNVNLEEQKYEKSLSAYVLRKIMSYCSRTIFAKKEHYMETMKINMITFINIYILYCTLSFNTIMRKIK